MSKIFRRIKTLLLSFSTIPKDAWRNRYKFKEYFNSDDFVKSANVLVMIHAYWPRELQYIIRRLNALKINVHVWVSIPSAPWLDSLTSSMQELDSRHNLNIFYVENRGRDFASFIHLIKKIEVSDFDLVIKLHTKRSQSAWFKVLVDYFIGSDKRIKSHRKHSKKFPYALLCHPLLRYQVDNTAKSNPALIKLYERLSTLNYHLVSNWSFPAGSMFATSTSFLHSLTLVFDELFDFDFESEEEYSQSSQAHMLERFVGLHAYQIGDGVISPFCKDYFDLRAATIALI